MMGPRAARKLPHYGDMFWYFGMWARAEAPHAYAAQSYRRLVADTRRAGGSPFLASSTCAHSAALRSRSSATRARSRSIPAHSAATSTASAYYHSNSVTQQFGLYYDPNCL